MRNRVTVWMTPRWVSPCGKFPTAAFVAGLASSASKPRSFLLVAAVVLDLLQRHRSRHTPGLRGLALRSVLDGTEELATGLFGAAAALGTDAAVGHVLGVLLALVSAALAHRRTRLEHRTGDVRVVLRLA